MCVPAGAHRSRKPMDPLAFLLFQGQTQGGSTWVALAPILFIFVIFYFLLILPQQKRQKKWQAMLQELKPGDRVVTSGGLRGTILSIKDDPNTGEAGFIQLRVPPDNLRLEVAKSAVVSVAPGEKAS